MTRLELIAITAVLFTAFGVWIGVRLRTWYAGYEASSMIITPPPATAVVPSVSTPLSKGVSQMGQGPSGNFRSVVDHDPPLPGTIP